MLLTWQRALRAAEAEAGAGGTTTETAAAGDGAAASSGTADTSSTSTASAGGAGSGSASSGTSSHGGAGEGSSSAATTSPASSDTPTEKPAEKPRETGKKETQAERLDRLEKEMQDRIKTLEEATEETKKQAARAKQYADQQIRQERLEWLRDAGAIEGLKDDQLLNLAPDADVGTAEGRAKLDAWRDQNMGLFESNVAPPPEIPDEKLVNDQYGEAAKTVGGTNKLIRMWRRSIKGDPNA